MISSATGTYDRKREFILTTSPSMDILISSNLERLIYRLTGEDAAEMCGTDAGIKPRAESTPLQTK